MANQYYTHPNPNITPIKSGAGAECQKSYIIVIGDGAMSYTTRAKNIVKTMAGRSKQNQIKNFHCCLRWWNSTLWNSKI